MRMTSRIALAVALATGCGGGTTPGTPTADASGVVTDDGGFVPADDGGTAMIDAGVVMPDGPHPFGTHGGYFGQGVIFPGGHAQAELDSATASFYDKWKAAYIEPACIAGQYRIKTGDGTDAYTVSEGHGYAMVITAMMEGHDPKAHEVFDGLYKYFDGHRSNNNPGLMAWAQDAQCRNVEGADSATDGDLDVAYSLLLADRQWGSAGAINYKAQALKVIAGILEADTHPANYLLVGDWSGPGDSHYDGTRPSDFMLSHLKSFGAASGVARWNQVVDKTYAISSYVQTHYAAQTGLLPGFVVAAGTDAPKPAPGGWLEGSSDGRYDYNACRVPWRLATDYLMSGDPRSQALVRPINAWIQGKTGGNPDNIKDGYQLNGTVTGSDPDLCFVAPFGVSAMVQPESGTNQPWLDKLWNYLIGRDLDGYYGDTVKMQSLLVMSGNWFVP
jgi:endoglucanase